MESLHFLHQELRPGLYLISAEEWEAPTSSVNCWLVLGEAKALLIDAGNPGNGLRAYAQALAGKRELILALSHGHFDHTGALDEFDRFLISPYDEPLLSGADGLPGVRYHGTPVPLYPGTTLDLGCRSVEVYGVRGHTPGSLVFLDRNTKTLLSGDSVARRGFFLTPEELSLGQYCSDLLAIEKLDFDAVASAHDRYLLKKDLIRRFITVLLEGINNPDGRWQMGETEFVSIHHGSSVDDENYLSISLPLRYLKKAQTELTAWKWDHALWLSGTSMDAEDIPAIERTTTLGEVASFPGFRNFERFIFNCRDTTWEQAKKMPVYSSAPALAQCYEGLKFVRNVMLSGKRVDYNFWSAEEIQEQPDRSGTKLFYFSGEENKPFVLVIPGGGYQSVCTHAEGFPTAKRLTEAGYNVFILSYRVRQKNLMPKPVEDAVRALRYIFENQEFFKVAPEYAVMGFSAGGHLAGMLGTSRMGVRAYGLPNPKEEILCYPLIDPSALQDGSEIDRCKKIFEEKDVVLSDWSLPLQLDSGYPPTLIWQCIDDHLLHFEQYRLMTQGLAERHIPHIAFAYPHGDHGLMGAHEEYADRWIEHVILFLRERL